MTPKVMPCRRICAPCLFSLLLCLPTTVFAGPQTQAGPYRVEITTKLGKLPTTGGTKLLFKITDSAGKPVEGVSIRSLTKMPTMNMGEREEEATTVPGEPGVYSANASFAMEGEYQDTLSISGPLGVASAAISLTTGQEMKESSGGPLSTGSTSPHRSYMPAVALLIVFLFAVLLLTRKRQAGLRASIRGIANRSVIGGLLLLGVIFWAAIYAVNHFRRPGAWTPIEAQGMEMNLPAPVGNAPVELATVERGGIDSTVSYEGQAVGYSEQDITPRVTGVITWMPLYVGDHVKRGQLLARLDTSQSGPQFAAQVGQVDAAVEGVEVARKEYQQAVAMVSEAHAEVGMKTGAVDAAAADIAATDKDRDTAQANLEAVQSILPDANAQLQAAQADREYWRIELDREARLLRAGAVTQEEYQRELAQSQNAGAKVQQAQAHITQVQAQIRAAKAETGKASAQNSSAKAKLAQARSELEGHHAHVQSADAAADSAKQRIVQAQAGLRQAKAVLSGDTATLGYSEIRAEMGGVVTERVISPGVLVSPGQTILKIAQISPIRLQASVAQVDLEQLHIGDRVLVHNRNSGMNPVVARITSIAPLVDAASHTGVVEAVVPNVDQHFLPGAYTSMDLYKARASNALRIPTQALRYRMVPSGSASSMQPMPTVWVAEPVAGTEGQYIVHEVTVKTGISDIRNTEILSGVEAGQKVVTAGQDYLKNDDLVSQIASNPGGA